MVPIQEYMFSQKCFKLIDTFALSVFTEPTVGTTTSSPDPGPTKLVTEEGHGSHAQQLATSGEWGWSWVGRFIGVEVL